MRILVTRPSKDAESLTTSLAAEGHSTIVSPLLEIQFVEGPIISLGGFQAILATSANGVHALADRTPERGTLLFAVGPETAAAATAEGFQSIRQGEGDAKTLALTVQQSIAPANGPLLYATGRDRTGQIEMALWKLGFAIHIEVLYAALALPLGEHVIAAIRSGEVDAVMLFSPRSARLFAGQVERGGLAGETKRLAALCISSAVADTLDAEQFGSIDVAASPDRDSMLALLRELSSHSARL